MGELVGLGLGAMASRILPMSCMVVSSSRVGGVD